VVFEGDNKAEIEEDSKKVRKSKNIKEEIEFSKQLIEQQRNFDEKLIKYEKNIDPPTSSHNPKVINK
jgi:dynactin complex subunit